MNVHAFLLTVAAFSLSASGMANVASSPRKMAKYTLGEKSGFAYNVNPETDPDMFITLGLMFRSSLRAEEGAIRDFCLLADKISEEGASAEGYSNDLKAIITVVGDECFAVSIADIKLSQKGTGRLWEYLTWNNPKGDYPLTRRALFGE